MTKPHIDKLFSTQWMYDEDIDFIHPSQNLPDELKVSNIWRFEGIGWRQSESGTWFGDEHKLLPPIVKNMQDSNDDIYTTHNTSQYGSLLKLQFNTKTSMQSDSGANRCVTNDITFLIDYEQTRSYSISGINEDTAGNIDCIGFGYLPLTTILNDTILVKTLHCPKSSGTIISPTAIVSQYKQQYRDGTCIQTMTKVLAIFSCCIVMVYRKIHSEFISQMMYGIMITLSRNHVILLR